MKKIIFIISLFLLVLSCNKTNQNITPDSIYKSCLEVFKRKGDAMGVGQAMCDSMKAACEDDINSKKCKKAQRMISKA